LVRILLSPSAEDKQSLTTNDKRGRIKFMAFDERSRNWSAATKEGREARLEGEPISSNPYQQYATNEEAALFVCWQRGWTQTDREIAASKRAAERGMAPETPRKLIAL
jgi:hypothetical protein